MDFTDRIDCPEKCVVPDSVILSEVPRPRHVWRDVFVCPNEGCGRAFLLVDRRDEDTADA